MDARPGKKKSGSEGYRGEESGIFPLIYPFGWQQTFHLPCHIA